MRDVELTYVGVVFRSPCNWRSGAPNPGEFALRNPPDAVGPSISAHVDLVRTVTGIV